MSDDETASGEASQGSYGVGNDAVKSLAEALTLILQQSGKQDGVNPSNEGSTQSM